MLTEANAEKVSAFDEEKNRKKSLELAEYADNMAKACDDAEKWVKRNGELVRNEQESLLKELRQSRRLLRKCSKAALKNTCAGVFGPSQAGKSYLVGILAKGESDKLLARFGEQTLDFLEEINPKGGKESTGLVTRFTMTRPENLPDGYPVQLRLLSEMDLVKIIANTYYADFESKEARRSNIESTLNELKKRAGSPNNQVNLDDMEDLREYLINEFGAKAGVRELERDYWTEAFSLAPKLSLEDRVRLYALIWDEVAPFTKVMLHLLQALASVEYADTLYCSLDALTPREKSIIDVETLKKLGSDEQDEISVCTATGLKKKLSRPVVTALTAELIIVMDEKPAPYFDHTDLLDFPGYRSRYKLERPHKDVEEGNRLHELLVRGKVAYLFQRYCAERELNNMLLCIPPSNQEVQDLPGVINSWIASTHGETPEEREGKQVSLLFILTKSDEHLKVVPGEPDVSGRWDTRLNASLLNFFGLGFEWPRKWTPDRGFDNLFLLRNTEFACSLMSHKGQKETGINPDMEKLANDLENAFLNSELVKAHFRNPKKSYDELIRFNDGGISLIRESLTPLCDPEIKRKQLLQNIERARQGLLRHLSDFYKTDDKEEMRAQKIKLADLLWDSLFKLQETKNGLGELIHSFTVKDSDFYDLHPEAIKRYREYRELQEENSRQEAEAKQKPPAALSGPRVNPFKNRKERASQPEKKDAPQTQDEEAFYAAFLESKWVDKLHHLAQDADAQKYFKLDAKEFSALVSELATGSNRLGFKDQLSQSFREIASYANTSKDTIVRKQAALAAQTFNDYIDLLGIKPDAVSDEEREVTSQDGEVHIVFKPHQMAGPLPNLDQESSPYYMDDWFGDWLYALGNLLMDNVYFDGTQTLNVAENSALGDILRQFRNELPEMAQ